jgi:hypothetical protein
VFSPPLAQVMAGLKEMFAGLTQAKPPLFVLMGNFTSKPLCGGDAVKQLKGARCACLQFVGPGALGCTHCAQLLLPASSFSCVSASLSRFIASFVAGHFDALADLISKFPVLVKVITSHSLSS